MINGIVFVRSPSSALQWSGCMRYVCVVVSERSATHLASHLCPGMLDNIWYSFKTITATASIADMVGVCMNAHLLVVPRLFTRVTGIVGNMFSLGSVSGCHRKQCLHFCDLCWSMVRTNQMHHKPRAMLQYLCTAVWTTGIIALWLLPVILHVTTATQLFLNVGSVSTNMLFKSWIRQKE